jgi:hypothetical protein
MLPEAKDKPNSAKSVWLRMAGRNYSAAFPEMKPEFKACLGYPLLSGGTRLGLVENTEFAEVELAVAGEVQLFCLHAEAEWNAQGLG